MLHSSQNQSNFNKNPSSSSSASILKRLTKEISLLKQEPPEGISIQLNDEDNLFEFQAIIDGPADTPFERGKFTIKVSVGQDYPSMPPKCEFITRIFHPNVNVKTGEICVDTLKKGWNSQLSIADILLTIKCLMLVPNAESALNEEAGKLLLEAYDEYSKRAKLFTQIHAIPVAMESGDSAGLQQSTQRSPDGKVNVKKSDDATKNKRSMLKRL